MEYMWYRSRRKGYKKGRRAPERERNWRPGKRISKCNIKFQIFMKSAIKIPLIFYNDLNN